ncbi:MAG: hypothetical protein AAGH74_14520, partial [Pseudomonadota bacterium]
CALVRVSYMGSARTKARRSHPANGPVLLRRVAPFCAGIDRLPFLEAWEAPEARKREMIETLWVIVKTFADLGWEITEEASTNPEETCGQVLDLRAALMAAVLRSEDHPKEESEEV